MFRCKLKDKQDKLEFPFLSVVCCHRHERYCFRKRLVKAPQVSFAMFATFTCSPMDARVAAQSRVGVTSQEAICPIPEHVAHVQIAQIV